MQLNRFITEQKKFTGRIKWIYHVFEIFLFACIAFGLYKTISLKEGLFYSLSNIISQSGASEKLKTLIDSITFYDALWLQAIIQLLLLWGIKYSLRKKTWNLLIKIVIADVIIATLLNLPFTGVGKASVADVQAVLNKSPKGIPIPALQPVSKNDTISLEEKGLVGDWSMYNKQIGVKNEVPYPICLKNIKSYLNYLKTTSYSPSLISISPPDHETKPEIICFTGNKMKFKIHSAHDNIVVYSQAFYPHWFYNIGKEKKAALNLDPFISAPVKNGVNEIEFSFEPKNVKLGMLVSLVFFIIIVITLLLSTDLFRSFSRQP